MSSGKRADQTGGRAESPASRRTVRPARIAHPDHDPGMSALTVIIVVAALAGLVCSVHVVRRYELAARFRTAHAVAARVPEQPLSATPPRP